MTSTNAGKNESAEQAKALQAQASADGLRFEAYLPPDLAVRVLSLVEGHVIDDPSEAVFVFLREQWELEQHRDLLEELLRRKARGARPLREVIAELRERAASSPARWENLSSSSDEKL